MAHSKRLLIICVLALAVMGAKCEGISPWSPLCPPLKQYNAAFRAALSAEIKDAMGRYPHMLQVITDFGVTRDDIRACMAVGRKK